VWDRHFKFYESRDILGADQGWSTNMHENSLAPGRSSQVPAIVTIWFTGRRSAQSVKVTEGNSALAGGPLD